MMKTPYPLSQNGKKAIKQAKKVEKNGLKKPIKKIDKNRVYAWVLLVLMVFWTFASVLSILNSFGGKNTISASADASTVASESVNVDYDRMDIDPFQYPTANLLNWPYDKFDDYKSGIEPVVNKDGTISVAGNLQKAETYGYAINTINSYFIHGATYTLSLYDLLNEGLNSFFQADVRCVLSSGEIEYLATVVCNGPSLTFNVPSGAKFLQISLIIVPSFYDGDTINSRLAIMYNQGATAYPYQPPYQLVYANGFNNGADGQYNAGYNAGLQAGTESAQAGIFNGLYADVTYWYYANVSSSETQKEFSIFPTIMKNRVDFSNITTEILEGVGSGIFSEMEVQLRFKSGYSVPLELFQFYVTASVDDLFGPDDWNKIFDVSTSAGTTTARFVLSETYGHGWRRFTVDETFYAANKSSYVSSIYNFTSSYIGAFDGFQLVSIQDNLYSAGYDDGLNQGRKDFFDSPEYKNALDNAHGKGFEQGKIVGYNQGVQSANDYSFFSLLSAVVDAPLAMFKDMFNFEILGVNLSSFALGLLTLAMVLGVVKLIL